MISTKEKITTSQTITLFISTILGVGILSLPRNLVDKTKGDGFLVIVVATLVAILLGYFIYKIIDAYPNKSFIEIGEILVGKPIAYILAAILFAHYLYGLGVIIRIFVEVVKMYMLIDTPTEVIMISMLLICAYGARGGLECIARISQLLVFLIVIPIVIVFLFTLNVADFTNLMPIFTTPPLKVVSAIYDTTFSFSGFETMLIIGCLLRRPSQGFKAQYISLLCIGMLYLFFSIISVAVFGQVETSHLLWPTLTLVKVINIPGAFIENVDALMMGAWTLNIFMTAAVYIYACSLLIGDMLNCKETSYLNAPIIPLAYLFALYPKNLAHAYDIMASPMANGIEVGAIAGIPVLLFLVMIVRKKVKRE